MTDDWDKKYQRVREVCDERAAFVLELLMKPYTAVEGRILPPAPSPEQIREIMEAWYRARERIYAPLIAIEMMRQIEWIIPNIMATSDLK